MDWRAKKPSQLFRPTRSAGVACLVWQVALCPLQNCVCQLHAPVRVAVVRVPVLLGNVSISGLAQCFDESMIGRRESVAGCNNKDRARRHGGRELDEVQPLLVLVDLAGQRLSARASERHEVAVLLQRFRLVRNRRSLGAGVSPGLVFGADVPRRDKHGGGNLRIVRGGGSSHVSAHAVADDDDAMRVDAILLRIGRVEDAANFRIGVFGGMGEGKVALHSPGAAVMHGQHIPAVGAESLRKIKILLKAGESVQDDCRGMRLCSSGQIEHPKKHVAMAGKNHLSCSGRRGRKGLAGALSGERQGKQDSER